MTLLYEALTRWPKPFISTTDLHSLFIDHTPASRYGIIKRAVSRGDLISIKRDLYLIKNHQVSPNTFELAPIIYGPSYISLESALSFHGWIPEAVRTTTSASIKRSVEFETPIGFFSYEHVPPQVFPMGIAQHLSNGITLFIASPIKALADYSYVRKREWPTLTDLLHDLRIEPESIDKTDKRLLSELIKNYPNNRVKKALTLLKEGLSH